MKEFKEHFKTNEELLESAISNDRHTIHKSIRNDNKETNQQEYLCQN